ncbi:hypothetical protein [Georgenia wangjunii]|uniref:hypothetical protein n=1 Tax=Georgenia wangjunii TaxID=3117730 RepID=UPI002F26BDA0
MTDGYTRPAGDPDLLGGPVPPPPTPPAPTTPPAPPSPYEQTSSDSGGVKDAAKGEASNVAQNVGDNAKKVAGTAAEEAKSTVAEASRHAKGLLDQTRTELSDQAGSQQQRLAGGLRAFSGELSQMADGAEQPGVASDLARQVSQFVEQAGDWLEQRDPSAVLDEVQRYARRHPGTFIAVAAGLGIVAGRLARSLKDNASDDGADVPRYGTTAQGGSGYTGTTTAPTGYGTAYGAGAGTTHGYSTAATTGGTPSSATGYTAPPSDDPALYDAPAESGPGGPSAPGANPYQNPGGGL